MHCLTYKEGLDVDMLIILLLLYPITLVFFLFHRLAKAEEDHHLAITEKLDLEARLNEELEMSKVCIKLMFHCT